MRRGGGVYDYKPGDVIVDEKDVEYSKGPNGTTETYVGKKIEMKYLVGNSAYVTLSGTKPTEMTIDGYSGEITSFSLKEIEENAKVGETTISVNKIKEGAFAGCTTLEAVDLTKNNAALSFEVGDYAFANCSALQSVTFPEKIYVEYNKVGTGAFMNDVALTSVTLGEKFTQFGEGAFAMCTSLSSISLPTKMSTVVNRMFMGCESLSTVNLPAGIKSIGSRAFESTALTAVPFANVTELRYIGDYAFQDTKLTTLTVPDSVTNIGTGAFFDCQNLTSVNIPFFGSRINSSGSFTATYGMTAEEDSIYSSTYSRELTVKVRGAQSIPTNAFYGCADIKSIDIKMAESGKYKVYQADGETFETVDFTLGNAGKKIGSSAFYGCVNLETLTLPDVTEIGSEAFFGCKNLPEAVALTDGVTTVGNRAYYGCESITSVTVPASVTTLGNAAFADCISLQSLTINAHSFTRREEQGNETVSIYATHGALSRYFSNGSQLADYRQEEYMYNTSEYGTGVYLPKSLKSVTVNRVTTLPDRMFEGWKMLTSATITFERNSQAPQELITAIGDNAFKDCAALTTLTLNDSRRAVKKIGSCAFEGCTALSSAVIPAGVKEIGNYAFRNSGLTGFTFTTDIDQYGTSILADCTKLQSIVIERYDYIGYNDSGDRYYGTLGSISQLFARSTVLDRDEYLESSFPMYQQELSSGSLGVYLPKSLTKLTVNSICQVPESFLEGVSSLQTVELTFVDELQVSSFDMRYPQIGSYAFYGCENLSALTMTNADKVQMIGSQAFANCKALPDSVLTDFSGVQTIGTQAFMGCEAFVNVTIPASVTTLGSSYNNETIFYNCPNIASLTVENYAKVDDGGYTSSSSNRLFDYVAPLFGAAYQDTFSFADAYYSVRVEGNYSSNYYVPKALKKVVLNQAIAINTYTFTNMTYLEEVEINFVKDEELRYNYNYSVDPYAFSECTALKAIRTNTPEVTVSFSSNYSSASGWFRNCYDLETIELPIAVSNNGSIANRGLLSAINGDSSSTYSAKLKEITLRLPETVLSNNYMIGYLFTTSNSFPSTVIPYSLKTINLVGYPVTEEGETAKMVIPAGLFNGTTYTGISEVVFKDEVTQIGYDAFDGCTKLYDEQTDGNVTVNTVNGWVVDLQTGATNIVLPADIVGIANSSIGNNYDSINVYFLGDKAAWQKVINPYYANLTVYFYSANKPTEYGPHWQYDSEATTTVKPPVAWAYDDEITYTFNANGGAFDSEVANTFEAKAPLMATDFTAEPTREGYFFGGWYADKACTKEVSFPYYSKTNNTLYAKWDVYKINLSTWTEKDGVYTSTNKGYQTSSQFTITAAQNVTVSFEFMISSDSSSYLRVDKTHNGSTTNITNQYRGSTDWRDVSSIAYNTPITLEAGDVLVIMYYNYSSNSSYYDQCASVRNLVITEVAEANV